MNTALQSHPITRPTWTTDDVRTTIEKSKVVVFAKGPEEAPRCGFTERVLDALRQSGRPFELVDVTKDRSVIAALKAFSGEHHLPLVYVEGRLVSSCCTQGSLLDSGELRAEVEKAFGQ